MNNAPRRTVVIALLTCFSTGCMIGSPIPQRAAQTMALIDRGAAELARGDSARAAASFAIAEEIEPSAESADGLGCVALAEGRYNEAERLFQRAQDRDPGYGRVQANAAALAELRGDLASARKRYRRAIELEITDGLAYNNAGVLAGLSGDSSRAQDLLNRAAIVSSDSVVTDNLLYVKGTHGKSKNQN